MHINMWRDVPTLCKRLHFPNFCSTSMTWAWTDSEVPSGESMISISLRSSGARRLAIHVCRLDAIRRLVYLIVFLNNLGRRRLPRACRGLRRIRGRRNVIRSGADAQNDTHLPSTAALRLRRLPAGAWPTAPVISRQPHYLLCTSATTPAARCPLLPPNTRAAALPVSRPRSVSTTRAPLDMRISIAAPQHMTLMPSSAPTARALPALTASASISPVRRCLARCYGLVSSTTEAAPPARSRSLVARRSRRGHYQCTSTCSASYGHRREARAGGPAAAIALPAWARCPCCIRSVVRFERRLG